MRLPVTLASLLLAAAVSASDPWTSVYDAWEAALGRDALALLRSKGFVAADAKDRRLLHAQWAALDPLAGAAPRLQSLSDIVESFHSDGVAPAEIEALAAAEAVPVSGLVTPAVKAAAALLAEAVSHRAALGGRAELDFKPLYRTGWGKAFAQRYHPATVEDAGGLVGPFFLRWLAGPERSAQARDHFLEYAGAALQKDAAALLERDGAAGAPSEELRDLLARYLADQRRRLRLTELREELRSLFRRTDLRRDLRDLRTIGKALGDAQGLSGLRASLPAPRSFSADAVAADMEHGLPRITGGDIHLHAPIQGAYELGDKIALSAAYWLDGLPEKRSAAVIEIGFVDRGEEGMQTLMQKAVSRRNGGPYAISVELSAEDTRPFLYRLILAAQGASPSIQDVQVVPGKKLERALEELGRADRTFQSCQIKEAQEAYAILGKEAETSGLAKGRSGLTKTLRRRVSMAEKSLAAYSDLTRTMPVARMDASEQTCSYRVDRAERARAILDGLPAGCGRPLAGEVDALLLDAARWRADQDAFDSALRSARGLEKDCRFEEAAARFAAGSAILDADPQARCGRWEEAYRKVMNEDLPRAVSAQGLSADIETGVEEASALSSAGDQAGALERLRPLLARIDALPNAGCWSALRKKAEGLASAAGAALPRVAAAQLPPNPVDRVLAEVSANKARLDRQAQASQTAPAASMPTPERSEHKDAAAGQSKKKPRGNPKRRRR